MIRTMTIKYSLFTLILLFIPAAIASIWISRTVIVRSPIKWDTYSSRTLPRYLDKHQTVVVLAKPTYDLWGDSALEVFEDDNIKRLYHSKRFVPLLLEYDNWEDPKVKSLFNEVGHTKHPFVVVYSPNESPVVIHTPFTAEKLRRHIPSSPIYPVVVVGMVLFLTIIIAARLLNKLVNRESRRVE